MSTPATLLPYAPAAEAESSHVVQRRRWGWLLLALPGAVAPFVPFACDATPVGAAVGWVGDRGHDRWSGEAMIVTSLAVGLILGFGIAAWRVRLMLRRPIGAAERWGVAAVAGTVSAGFVLAMVLMVAVTGGLEAREWASLGLGAGALGSGVAALWFIRRGANLRLRTLALLLVPYVATAGFCLPEFWGDRRVGWYLTLVSGPAAAVELCVITWRAFVSRRAPS